MQQQQSQEISRLRREMIHAKQQIGDLQEELAEKNALMINAISEKNNLKEQWNNTKESINKVESIVQSKVDVAMQRERGELAKLREENKLFRQRMELMDQEKEQMQEEKKQLIDKVRGLTQDLAYYTRNIDAKESLERIERLREERDQKEREIHKHLQQINENNNNIEDLMAENRILRKMASVPENYGKNLVEQIKLHDREKIEDYKKLITVLQDDNYKLEEERARLKHLLKQQSILYKQEPSQRYKGLTQEQIFKVDQYVMKMKEGLTEDPSDFYKLKKENQNLKAQLEALNSKGFEMVKKQIEVFFNGKGFGDSSKQLDKIQDSNNELTRLLKMLVSGGIVHEGGAEFSPTPIHSLQTGRYRPPVPQPEYDGSINTGFSHKFQSQMDVVGKDGRPGIGDVTRYDTACMQLYLQECLELIRRKDENLTANQNTIDTLYRRVRDYLLIQDQLYKDYVHMEKEFNEKKTALELNLRSTKDELNEEKLKVEKMTRLVKTLEKGDKNSIEHRIIELTKQNSILEINTQRLARRLQSVEEENEMLRRDYHSYEVEMAEKDLFVQDRIHKLKEWKAKAILQLDFMFKKLRLAIPLTEYQSTQSQCDLVKQKNADLIDKNAKMAQSLSKMQTHLRENMEFEERYRNLQELKDEAENELEVIKKRLEHADPNYRWENAIFNKIVAVLKRVKVSPQQAFEEFDLNKDGKLKRDEFMIALEKLKVSDLSIAEVDLLMNSLDTSGDGEISYQEFIHKLSRHGIRSRTTEEEIIYLIGEALKRNKVKSLLEAFTLIDKEGRGYISKEDFRDIFRNLSGLKIDQNALDKFIDQFWKDKSAGIDYQQFLRIFNRYQIRLEEQDQAKPSKYIKIPEEIIMLKKSIFMKLNEALIKAGKSLKGLFSRVDVDQSEKIDEKELEVMFNQKMNLGLKPLQIKQIFESIDFDYSGDISLPELQADFDYTVRNDIDKLIMEEREKAAEAARGDGRAAADTAVNEEMLRNMSHPMKQNQEAHLQTRITIIEQREKQMQRKFETCMRILKHTENAKSEIQVNYNQLETKWIEMSEEYHLMRSEIVELQEEKRQSVNKTEAERIKRFNEQLQTELVETKAAMLSYKGMVEVVADQTKGLKLMIERKKDENENLINAVRELQSQSVDQQRLGKLYSVVMLSRWLQASANKKYDMILTETRELRKELMNSEQLNKNKDERLHECENSLQKKQFVLEKLQQQLSSTKNMFLTLDKAQEFSSIIQDISDDKTELEEHYFKLRSEFLTTQIRMDEAVSKYESTSELLNILENKKQSELSDKVIEMSQKLQGIRLTEMKATRELDEIKEKNNYLSRLLKTKVEQVQKFEESVSEFESRLHKREEEFRRADNDRMKRFFNSRYDTIQATIESDGGSSPKKLAFQDSLADKHSSISAPPTYIQQMEGQRPVGRQNTSDIDMKMLEGQIKKLKDELKNAVDNIKSKDAIINRFKEWQLADKYLSQDEVLRDAIDQHKSKTQEIHEQESKEMAEAAYVTIKTLQEMLDQKNSQLRDKDNYIEKLNQMALIEREKDQNEIARLRQQLSLAADTTLSKLQELVVKNSHTPAASNKTTLMYERMTREDLQKTLLEKDFKIQELSEMISGLKAEFSKLGQSKKELIMQNQQLEQKVWEEKQNNQQKANHREIDDLKKKLKHQEGQNEKLSHTIKELNLVMQNITKDNFNITEDHKMTKIQENSKVGDLMTQVTDLKRNQTMKDTNLKLAKEELKKLKISQQEKEDREKKLILERDEAAKALKQRNETIDAEIKKRQALQIEVNALRQKHTIDASGAGGVTFEHLQAKTKEMENDILILQCKQKTVVTYNKESATFEYIGEPALLNFQKELTDVEEVVTAMKAWLEKNQRLTVKSIFEAMDKENFGELTDHKFDLAMAKIGVKLREKEKHILKQILDPKGLGYIKYRPLVRELSGIPQLEFLPVEIIKLAKLVEFRNLTIAMFYQLIDPLRYESMTLQQFQDTMALVKAENFEMKAPENENVFKYITKAVRTTGVTLSVSKLGERVFVALHALLIEKIRDALFKSMKSLQDLFQKHDSNKDGFLTYSECENLFLECQIAFKPNMVSEVFSILDPGHKFSKISFPTLKFYLSDTSSSLGGRSYDLEPSQDMVHLSEETSLEELNVCRVAARKILSACQNNLPELLMKADIHNEGLIGREDIIKVLEEQKVKDLSLGELNLVLKYADKAHKGYICTQFFLDKLQELAVETKADTMLRRLGATLKHQGIDIRVEMQKHEQGGKNTKLDKNTFAKAMKQLSIALTNDEIDLLFQSSEIHEQKGHMDIRTFITKVNQAQKSKPLPTFIAQPPKVLSATAKVNSKGQTGVFENWEVEKKYKKKLEALQQQIEESKKETQGAEKQSKHWQEMANKLEKEKNALQTRLVDINAKPPKATMYESLNQGQLEQMQGLKDQLFYLQEENHKLERTIQVELKSEMGKINRDKEKQEEKIRYYMDENKRLEHQVSRLIGKPLDQLEQREEGELWREKRIQELEKILEHKESKESETQDQLFRTEKKALDLKFQNETYELQYARLQKRITDLEQYKLASSKYSSVLKNHEADEHKRIEEISGASNMLGSASKKQTESVKLRNKSSKSVAELEMVIESLKRVIEKQKTENDNLQKQLDHHEKKNEKLRSEKTMRQKIENLEQEVHSYEVKDANMGEKDQTIRKLHESYKIIKEDLKREGERYQLLEKKYKDLLIKYNVLSKDHASHVEKLFSMASGGNIHNYENYLSKDEEDLNARENPWASKAEKKRSSGQRQFEDIIY